MNDLKPEIEIDHIIRSKRRTISLEVKRDGRLIVRAPFLTPRGQIEELLKAKNAWIKKKQELVKKRAGEITTKQFISGEDFLYLGKSYPLVIVDDQEESLILKEKFFLAASSQESANLVFVNWYKRQALGVIQERAALLAHQNGFEYTRIRITAARTRWGSCGAKGSLNFSWRLVMAPIGIIDYVVLHELVHLEIKNHSKVFWRKVQELMGDYKHRKRWLKDHGYRLVLE
jgi:predicted metal-dependent hydrolase